MVRKQNKELEHMKLYVAELMNEEQNFHSKLVADMRRAGLTDEVMFSVLKKIYDAKREVLERVYKEMQVI